ncbi:MAG: hypothetical protein HRT57_04020 [Crocinitomicaceae bacterium]|nr:hypothetical protein [Crocinitomicaceae bacterium]
MFQWKKVVLLLVVLLIVDQLFAQGCSQCKMLAEQGQKGDELGEGSFGTTLNYGILYLMAIPYILLMFFFRKRFARLFRALTTKK